jgi:DNA recombination protein RmuC
MGVGLIYVLAALVAILMAVVAWLALSIKRQDRGEAGDALLMLQQQNEALRREFTSSLGASSAAVNEQLSRVTAQVSEQMSRVAAQVSEQLGAVTGQMLSSTGQLSSQVSEQMSRVTAQVSEQLGAVAGQMQTSTGQLNERLDNAARVVGEVKQGLGTLGKAAEQIFDVGKDIASLQEILSAPKLRGGLGEFFLADLLKQILPGGNYELQHAFRSGARVDAVIKLADGMVPIDSKFPMENFRRLASCVNDDEKKAHRKKFISDVKKHIDAIASNYILPDEGTLNFALMYIPAENVYYETIIKDDELGEERLIASHAFAKRVIPVSPNSFYAYLQTILMGLRGMEISKRAQEILSQISRLNNDFERFSADFEIIGTHINNTRGKYEAAQARLLKFGDKLRGIEAGGEDKREIEA